MHSKLKQHLTLQCILIFSVRSSQETWGDFPRVIICGWNVYMEKPGQTRGTRVFWMPSRSNTANLQLLHGVIQCLPSCVEDSSQEYLFLSASQDQNIHIWKYIPSSSDVVHLHQCKGHARSVEAIAVSPDRTKVRIYNRISRQTFMGGGGIADTH